MAPSVVTVGGRSWKVRTSLGGIEELGLSRRPTLGSAIFQSWPSTGHGLNGRLRRQKRFVRRASPPNLELDTPPPLLPDNLIAGVEVSDSRYFGPFSAEFNPQLNTIIGGRGSGKSTILEYIRWALCDQGYVYQEDEGTELSDYERRRRSLVGTTLKPSQGNVKVYYIRHGVPHQIRREAATGKVYLRVADQAEQETTEEIIQSLAQIQGYSQKQLSHVSVRSCAASAENGEFSR